MTRIHFRIQFCAELVFLVDAKKLKDNYNFRLASRGFLDNLPLYGQIVAKIKTNALRIHHGQSQKDFKKGAIFCSRGALIKAISQVAVVYSYLKISKKQRP